MKKVWFDDLLSLLYPSCCRTCNQQLLYGEELLCADCMSRLPVTNHFRNPSNPVRNRFVGLLPIKHGFAYLKYGKDGITQKLLHQLKYDGIGEIGEQLGRWFGHDLAKQYPGAWDVIVPVPLHPMKLKIRGYNQSERFADGLSQPLAIPVITDAVKRVVHNDSQTKKSKVLRWRNTQQLFVSHHSEALQGKEVLLVDDVLTTGATLEACGKRILEAGAKSVSFCTIAWA